MTKTPIRKARVRVVMHWYLRGSVLQDRDGGDVRERLRGVDVGIAHLAGIGPKQVQGADD